MKFIRETKIFHFITAYNYTWVCTLNINCNMKYWLYNLANLLFIWLLNSLNNKNVNFTFWNYPKLASISRSQNETIFKFTKLNISTILTYFLKYLKIFTFFSYKTRLIGAYLGYKVSNLFICSKSSNILPQRMCW